MTVKARRAGPRFSIEKLRTLLLVAGGLLIAAIAIFLAAGQWKRRQLLKDLPGRLGVDIQQSANGVDYTQSRKGKTLFKIHAAKAVQMKKDGKTLLHDVKIDLYGEDGKRTDTISGAEFEYDPGAGIAQAAGEVEITLMRPGVQPAIAQLKPGAKKPVITGAVANRAANEVADGEIHVKTSGLTFDQKKGLATTEQRVDFALTRGSGSSTGATYDSGAGVLVLDRSVELHVERAAGNAGAGNMGGPVTIRASHALFEKTDQVCTMTQAQANYAGGQAQVGNAVLHFRDDGSVIRMDGSGGVDLKSVTGGHVTAPRGILEFDENNHPQHGLLEGGAKLAMTQPNRQIVGTAPTARLIFTGQGDLQQTHLEHGVLFTTDQPAVTAKGAIVQVKRTWKSDTADIAFAGAKPDVGSAGKSKQTGASNRVEPQTIHGNGGVVITSESTGTGGPSPSRLAADAVVAQLDEDGALTSLTGTGHANFEQRTEAGVHQASSSDSLVVTFSPDAKGKATPGNQSNDKQGKDTHAGEAEIVSIVQTGHVVMLQDPVPGGARDVKDSKAQQQVRATSDTALYDGASQQLVMKGSPRFKDGSLDLTAVQLKFSKASGDAEAQGDVKASWVGGANAGGMPGGSLLGGGGAGAGNQPVHAIAAFAQLHQATSEVEFKGTAGSSSEPRIWQGANSITAPNLLLNRLKQTLVATAGGAKAPVETVLLRSAKPGASANGDKKAKEPSLIRLKSGDLKYSEAQRLAVLTSGDVSSVTAITTDASGDATVTSQRAEVHLMPAGVHGDASGKSTGGVDSMTATGKVSVVSPGRKGTGEKLVYRSEDGTSTLTGTAAAPPRIVDSTRGTVTGAALIFHSRDDSVTVEGDGGKTVTETQSPK
jgi:lipopolysaccharide export system protein LptA